MTPHYTPAREGWVNQHFRRGGISYRVALRKYEGYLYPLRGQPGRFHQTSPEWKYWAIIAVDAAGRPLRNQEEPEDEDDEEDEDDDEAPIDWPPKPKLSKTYMLELIVLLDTREGIRPDNLIAHRWHPNPDQEELDLPTPEEWANLLLADDETWENVEINEDFLVTKAPFERGDAFWNWMIEKLLNHISRERKAP